MELYNSPTLAFLGFSLISRGIFTPQWRDRNLSLLGAKFRFHLFSKCSLIRTVNANIFQ